VKRLARAAAQGAARGAGALRHRPLGAAAAALAVAVGFALLTLTGVARQTADSLVAAWSSSAGMIVYLDEGVTEPQARRIGGALAALPAVEQVTYVPPDRALEHVRQALGADSEAARGLEPGMLPASLEVVLADGALEVARRHPLVDRLERTEGVDEVAFAGDWVGRVRALGDGLQGASRWLALLVAFGCAYVLAVTVRLRQAESSAVRGEARTWWLVGAPGWFVRGPAAVEGALLGALGAAAGIAAGWLVFAAAREPAAAALGGAFGPVAVDFLPLAAQARLVLLGGGLGLLAGLAGGAGGRPRALA